jgi:hypothetical protein
MITETLLLVIENNSPVVITSKMSPITGILNSGAAR